MNERMPPLSNNAMSPAQRAAAAALSAGPRKGVKGPFVPLLRTPELMDRLQKVGEYLRFQSSLPPRISEIIMLIVARDWTQQFEWAVHTTLGRQAGLGEDSIRALAEGRRPPAMQRDETVAYDFCEELLRTRGVCEVTYQRAAGAFGEHGVMDIVGVLGYFITVSMAMNVAHTPPPDEPRADPLVHFPF